MSIGNDSSHWYDAQGNACHTQKCGPKAKNPTRPTTIRDARKIGLFPSVTSILGILEKKQLERWKFRQITDWCAWNLGNSGEDTESYFNRAIDGAFQKVQDAADVGTRIHAILEGYHNGQDYDREETLILPEYGPVQAHVVIQPILFWFDKHVKNVYATEKVLVNKRVGFAGTADLLCETNDGKLACIDFKTRKTQPGKPCEPYDGQPMQIAAYAKTAFGAESAFGVADITGCNLFISTTEPGRIADRWYTERELKSEYKAFCHVVEVWKHLKQYDPTEGGQI